MVIVKLLCNDSLFAVCIYLYYISLHSIYGCCALCHIFCSQSYEVSVHLRTVHNYVADNSGIQAIVNVPMVTLTGNGWNHLYLTTTNMAKHTRCAFSSRFVQLTIYPTEINPVNILRATLSMYIYIYWSPKYVQDHCTAIHMQFMI